jgi:tetratricopeptide (TPR) repeat protein
LYNDLLPLNEEININLGFYSSIISNYVHKCLITMKENEYSKLTFNYSSENQSIEIFIHLISFERSPEIYSLSIDNLYNFALKHKENANKFYQSKNYPQAFKLYHRSLCYILNYLNEEPTNEYFEKFNQLILSIYSNTSACQLIYGNNLNVIENCSSALEINPKYVKALYRRGCAYANLNDYELALKDLQLADRIQPNEKDIEDLLKITKQRFEEYKKTLGNSLKNLF